jgi:hypothetical protein
VSIAYSRECPRLVECGHLSLQFAHAHCPYYNRPPPTAPLAFSAVPPLALLPIWISSLSVVNLLTTSGPCVHQMHSSLSNLRLQFKAEHLTDRLDWFDQRINARGVRGGN